jgi:hypothetical protein
MPANRFPFGYFDLGEAHAISSGKHKVAQEFAHDFGAVRLENGTWTEARPGMSTETNDGYLIWGMPVYAIADGEVVAAWRNAPDNEAPGTKRPEVSAKRDGTEDFIALGGNHIHTIDPATGLETRYGHFMEGTIPAHLVQNHSRFMRRVSDNDIVGTRPKVFKGQFIGLGGSSGNSTNPHCHIEQWRDGQTFPILFETWWSKPGSSTTGTDGWTEEHNAAIPQQLTRSLPPYRQGHGFVLRHGIPSAQMQFSVEHAVASGYRPVLIDGFEAGGTTRYNMICRPFHNNDWLVRHRLETAEYQLTVDTFFGTGFRIDHVNSYMSGEQVLRSLIMSKTPGPDQLALHGLTEDEHRRKHHELVDNGFRPVNVSVVAPGGRRSYTVLYERGDASDTVLHSRLTEADYQREMNANVAAGRVLSYLDAYMNGGAVNFSGIWRPGPTASFGARHGLGPLKFQTTADEFAGAGSEPVAVAGYNAGAKDRYAVAWDKA